MKVADLLETYDNVTRREWLKLQQEFIEDLDDKWNIDLNEQGLVFTHEGGKTARINNADFGDVNPKTLFAEDRIKFSKITDKLLNGFPVFDITFPTVNYAVKTLLHLYSYNLYELIRNRDEVEAFAGYMMSDIVIV